MARTIENPSTVILNTAPDRVVGAHMDHTVLVAQRLEAEKATDVALAAWSASVGYLAL